MQSQQSLRGRVLTLFLACWATLALTARRGCPQPVTGAREARTFASGRAAHVQAPNGASNIGQVAPTANLQSLSTGLTPLPCGTYDAITISQSNYQLVGSGDCTVLTAPATTSVVTVTNHASNVRIADLQIEGQASGDATTQRCIYLTGGSTGTTIEHVRFSGTTAANGCNIQIHSDSTSSENVIRDNVLTQAVGTVNTGYGILLEDSNNNIVEDNLSIQSSAQGRHHIYVSAGSSYNLIRGNRLIGGTNDQIDLFAFDTEPQGQYNLIEGNVLSDMASGHAGAAASIHLAQNVAFNKIDGNEIVNPGTSGIEVEASQVAGQSHASDNSISNNLIYCAGDFGIEVLGASRTLVESNRVYDSSQSSPGSYPGISVSSNSSNAVAANNRILGNFSYGASHQRSGLRIDPGPPAALATEVSGNSFGTGIFGPTLDDEGTGSLIGINIAGSSAPSLDAPVIEAGVSTNGNGFKHIRAALGCTTAALSGSNCTSSPIAWSQPFADASYTLACTLEAVTGQPHISGVSKQAASFQVTIAADTPAPATGTVDCIGVHD